jgi:hypothetical protein
MAFEFRRNGRSTYLCLPGFPLGIRPISPAACPQPGVKAFEGIEVRAIQFAGDRPTSASWIVKEAAMAASANRV